MVMVAETPAVGSAGLWAAAAWVPITDLLLDVDPVGMVRGGARFRGP